MNTADQQELATAIDGHVIGLHEYYTVVVSVKGNIHHQSEVLPEPEARKRLAKLIKFQMVTMGYKQVSYGDCVTLKSGRIEMQIQLVKAVNS